MSGRPFGRATGLNRSSVLQFSSSRAKRSGEPWTVDRRCSDAACRKSAK
jgi:hypothetical protein